MLNLGCGSRYINTPEWTNVDYPGKPPRVQRVNLRHELPFPAKRFRFVYSSHVLDHFPLLRAERLLREVHFTLQDHGLFRISVPDLEVNARNYLASIERNRELPDKHRWYTIELLDQMTRTERGGEKARFLRSARAEPVVQAWLKPLLGAEMLALLESKEQKTLRERIKARMRNFLWGGSVEETGERHYWTFDEIGLGDMLLRAGFSQVRRVTWDFSQDVRFSAENLDAENGREYKPGSLYMEATK